MAVGTGATTLRHLPDLPFAIDPTGFAARTRRNVRARSTIVHQPGTQLTSFKVPATGVLGFLRIMFMGQVVVNQDPDAAINWRDWPYGLIERLTLRFSGSSELWSVPGTALQSLRFVRFPAYEDATDTFPGQVGGGGSTVTDGTYQMFLTYDLPIPVEPTHLGAALFLQSSAIDCDVRIDTAPNPAGLTISGSWIFEPHHFEVPYADDGTLIVPDLSRRHGFNHTSAQFAGTGEVEVPLIRSAGQLHRLFFWVDTTAGRLSAHPAAAAASRINSVRLEYAGNQVPYNFEPASSLMVANNEAYGAPLPYRMLVLDLVRENTMRDPIEMQGVTDLRLIVDINSSVNAAGGRLNICQETLF